MRTTLDIDDDILQAAKELARAEGKTAGQVISELVRKALTAPSQPGLAEERQAMLTPFDPATDHSAWITLSNREGVVVTQDMIERIQEELDLEDADIHDFTKHDFNKEGSG